MSLDNVFLSIDTFMVSKYFGDEFFAKIRIENKTKYDIYINKMDYVYVYVNFNDTFVPISEGTFVIAKYDSLIKNVYLESVSPPIFLKKEDKKTYLSYYNKFKAFNDHISNNRGYYKITPGNQISFYLKMGLIYSHMYRLYEIRREYPDLNIDFLALKLKCKKSLNEPYKEETFMIKSKYFNDVLDENIFKD